MATVERGRGGATAGSAAAAAATAEKPKVGDLPVYPTQRTLTLEQLLGYWRSVPSDFQHRLCGYLYRVWPVCNRRALDPKNYKYIAKYDAPFESQTTILREHGTGAYKLVLSDSDKRFTTQLGKELCEAWIRFSESYADVPPILEYGELELENKQNRDYVQWLRNTGKLPAAAIVPQAAAGAEGGPAVSALAGGFQALLGEVMKKNNRDDPVDKTVGVVTQMLADANKRSVDMVVSQAPSASSAAALVKEIAAAFRGSGSDDSAPLFKALIELNKEQNRELKDLMLKLIEGRQNGGGLSGVKEAVELFGSLREIFHSDTAPSRGGDRWYHMFEPYLPQVLSVAQTAAAGFAASRVSAAVPGAGAAPAPQSAPAPGMVPQHPGAALVQLVNDLRVPLVNSILDGAEGRDFADWVQPLFHLHTGHFDLLRSAGRDVVVEFVRRLDPSLSQVAPERLAAFVDGFLAWSPGGRAEEGEPGSDAPVAPPMPAGPQPRVDTAAWGAK